MRIAIVGCGAISTWHRRAIDQVPELELVAAVDIDVARADRVAAGTGARSYATLDAAIAAGGFDAVDVLLPHELHEHAAIRVLDAGRHLLLEKPMAPTVRACERMLAAGRRAGRVFMVGETAQYWPAVLCAQGLVRDGRVGELVEVSVAVRYPASPQFHAAGSWRMHGARSGGGIALDAGPHFLRALRLICGEIVQVLAVFGHPYAAMEGESHVRAMFRTARDVIASMDLLLTDAPVAPHDTFRITGTRGEVRIGPRGVMLHDSEAPEGRLVAATGPDHYFDSFRGELQDFASAVLNGSPLAAPPEMARDEVAIVEAMRASAVSGRWESLEPGASA